MTRLVILPVDNLISIFLELEIKQLVTFSKDELYPFLLEKTFLDLLAVKHNLPFSSDLKELEEYERVGGLDARMAFAARKRDLNAVKRMLKLGATDYNSAMAFAAKGGRLKIAEMMLELGATNYNWPMALAAEGGHIEIVERMLELGATDYGRSMALAALGGHIEIVERMLELGATDYGRSMALAALGGHIEIVNLIRRWKETH